MSSYNGILQRTKGSDICGKTSYQWIIRSDLGYYMRAFHLRDHEDVAIHRLHPSCKGGDHYAGSSDGRYFYVIKGKSYRRVTDLSTDADATVQELPVEYQGADFYLSKDLVGKCPFYAIFSSKGEYKDSNGERKLLHENCQGGLYYFATKGFFYLVKPVDEWGIQYHRTRNLSSDEEGIDFSFDPTIANFLPGGLSATLGHASEHWVLVKKVDNQTCDHPIEWSQEVRKKVGYKKQLQQRFEDTWKVKWACQVEAGFFQGLLKNHLSMELAVGAAWGHSTQEWQEEIETVETMRCTIKPGNQMFIWQHKISLGGMDDAISGRDLVITSSPTPPGQNPIIALE